MGDRILITGQPNIVRSKLISIIGRTENTEIADDICAAGYSVNKKYQAIIVVDELLDIITVEKIHNIVEKLIFVHQRGLDSSLTTNNDDLVVEYDDIYGFSGYGSEESYYIPIYDKKKEGKNICPLLIDDLAFWILQNYKNKTGYYFIKGPEAVKYEEYFNTLNQNSRRAVTVQCNSDKDEIIGRHGFKKGLDIVGYQKRCCINVIYKLSEKAFVRGKSVYALRYMLGSLLNDRLIEEKNIEFDFISPVPNTGITYAKGLSESGSYKYLEILKKNSDIRSFDIENEEIREQLIKRLIVAEDNLLVGKRIILVDEAIFTGITLKVICSLLRKKGVKSIVVMIPTPPCVRSCDHCSIPVKPMLLEKKGIDETAKLIGADRVIFQKRHRFEMVFGNTTEYCTECFI